VTGSPDLFDAAAEAELARRGPLATRLRPRRLDEVVGQRHLLAEGAPLRALIEADRLGSAVFFGPPGSGKTTVAELAARASEKAFVSMSAVSAGVREVREVLERARHRLGAEGRGTILFLDEVHHFSRAQQDALLPGVEAGTVVLVGATTENPFFSLAAPLLSRATLWRFEPLGLEDVRELIGRALACEGAEMTPEACERCARLAGGDGRAALTTVEVAVAVAASRGRRVVEVADVEAARQTRVLGHGRDEHYDLTSAFVKSIRGSDPDAALYWLARLLAAGEDPRFVARRLVIAASEEVGMADPSALVVAVAAATAVERVGLPEGALGLAQATVHLASAPKSNRCAAALWAAQADVASGPLAPVPARLRDAHYAGAAALGHGVGYEYPHDDPRGYVPAAHLPEALAGRRYYVPSPHGAEAEVAERLERLREGAPDRVVEEGR